MRPSFGLIVLGIVAVAALVYGVVLNGFGLFDQPQPTTVQSAVEAAPTPATAGDRPSDSSPAKTQSATATQPAAETTPPAAEPEPLRVARDVTPPNVLSRPTSRYLEPEEPERQPEEAEQGTRRYHRVIVRDASTLEADDLAIHFAGISPIPADKTCTDDTGKTWPCGRVAAAALRLLIRNRSIDCTVASETADGVIGTCSAGLLDINGWLVEQGWASVSPGADYAEEAELAKSEKRGIYLAEWRAKGPGGSGFVPQAAFSAPQIPPDAYSVTLPQGAVERAPN